MNITLRYKISLVMTCITFCSVASAQQIDKLEKKDLFGFSGSVGAVGTFYTVAGMEANRDPFFWQLNVNANVKTIGIDIPFSVRLSQQQKSFTQPFNQYGLSPKYKKTTLHLGHRSMKLSEYSLGGTQFFGVGLETTYKFVTIKTMYGQFAKAVDGYYSDGRVVGEPSYERDGGGVGIYLGEKDHTFGIVFFKAKDKVASITNLQNDNTIKPADNIVLGLLTKQKISKSLSFDFEIDWSAFTSDIRMPEEVLEGYSFINNLGGLFYTNRTTSINKAMTGKLKFKKKRYSTNLKYRRIDPGYRTHGSVYLNNDFEDISGNGTFNFLNNKLIVGGNLGLQRNNLQKEKVTQTVRVISGLMANFTPNSKWNFGANYSNFSAQTAMTLVVVEDTMRYGQVTKSYGSNATRNFMVGGNKLTTTLNGMYQDAKINNETNSTLYNTGLTCVYNISKIDLNLLANVSYNNVITVAAESSSIGPSVGGSKSLLKKKISFSLISSLLKSYVNSEDNGLIINNKLSANYKVIKKGTIKSSLSYAIKESNGQKVNEMIASIGFNYVF